MPTLNWIGKEAVIKHHLGLPYHTIEDVPELSCGQMDLGNLVLQGDNLLALKALLPYYSGRVKCIYIDPPYNTGNEGWIYNDNVSSPIIREWLGKVVGKEGETLDRHDRWLCMMYPRLALLKDFLTEDGSIFVSIDDNEVATLRLIMDEIFGVNNFVANVIWRSSDASNNDAKTFSVDHNHTLVYSRTSKWVSKLLARTEEKNAHYKNPDNDPRGPWFAGNLSSPNPRPNLRYVVTSPNGIQIAPPANGWRWKEDRMKEMIDRGEIVFSADGSRLIRKTYLIDQRGLAPSTLWADIEETGHNRNAKYELKKLFPENDTSELFKTPKPPKFIEKILNIATNPGDIILDSFAGSGTTAHAVINLNRADPSQPARRFILIELEEKIAKDVTAERIRRVISSSSKVNTQECHPEGFKFCTLGKPLFDKNGVIDDGMDFESLARHVFFTETGRPLPVNTTFTSPFIGEADGVGVYLLFGGISGTKTINKQNVLTRTVLAQLPQHDGPKVIYCAGSRLSQERLQAERIVIRQIPYEIKVA